MLVSIIIIKLIINLISWYYYSCSSQKLCFKTENLFDAQFDELKNVCKFTQEPLARGSSFDHFSAPYYLCFHISVMILFLF